MTERTTTLVLHAIRLRSVAPAEVAAARFALDPADADAALGRAADAGWVRFRASAPAGWSLTVDGRDELASRLAAEVDAAGVRGELTAAYERFLPLNGEVLAICTDWQTVTGPDGVRVNDHRDLRHDRAVLGRLEDVHRRALPVTEALAGALARLAGYGERLDRARRAVRDGGVDWLTKPTVDSYHTVWFELHEDLLATLGRTRSQERHGAGRSDRGAA